MALLDAVSAAAVLPWGLYELLQAWPSHHKVEFSVAIGQGCHDASDRCKPESDFLDLSFSPNTYSGSLSYNSSEA